jgi:hypothetical protein
MFGSFSNTVGRPSGSSRVTISPLLVVHEDARARLGEADANELAVDRTSSPGPTFCPHVGGLAIHVMRPARIISSIARREPNPHDASTLCRRCGS